MFTYEICFEINPFSEDFKDIFIALLSENGYDEFLETQIGFNTFSSSAPNENEINDIISVCENSVSIKFIINKIEHKNWNEEWEKSIKPLIIADKCLIYTSFHENLPDLPYKIIIDPKMAFGTGHHQTTELIIESLFEINLVDLNVLDMGCGTGILAILSSMLGAKKVLAIDNDINSVNSTKENLLQNNISNTVVYQADILENQVEKFDFIIANINRNILIELAESFANNIKEKGLIILSGFYKDDLEIIDKNFSENGFNLISYKQKDNWIAPIYQKK